MGLAKRLSQNGSEKRLGLVAAGGLLGALAASSCCIMPLALFGLGVSGAWIGNLTALEPYQPIFFIVAAGLIGTGHYLAYRRPKAVLSEGAVCVRSRTGRLVNLALWAATVLVAAAMAFPYVAPILLRA